MTKPITYGRKFFEIKFSAETMKQAYMKACKWYATNVLSKDELHEVQVEFEKGYDEQQFPTITIHLFVALDEEIIKERHCKICREVSKSPFTNKVSDCNNCEVTAYQKRKDDTVRVKAEYYKELIAKTVKKNRR